MFRFLPALLRFISSSYAQWSTSTRAESTLYVCPGFYPGIVTFDDGSSIVHGALNSYIYARKLDERGYYLWPPIQVMHNDSSFVTETPLIGDWGGWISDGDGGVILFWYDHRGAYISGPDWANRNPMVPDDVKLWALGQLLAVGQRMRGANLSAFVNSLTSQPTFARKARMVLPMSYLHQGMSCAAAIQQLPCEFSKCARRGLWWAKQTAASFSFATANRVRAATKPSESLQSHNNHQVSVASGCSRGVEGLRYSWAGGGNGG